jgi:integrase
MEIEKRTVSDGSPRWRVRWYDAGRGSRYRVRTFDRKTDAVTFAAEVHRRRQSGSLGSLDGGRMTLADYVSGVWARAYRQNLSASTRMRYGYLYDKHVLPELGPLRLVEITPEVLARWQADRLAGGSGPVAVRSALTLLGGILQRAVEAGHIQTNAARAVRKAPLPRSPEVRPLAPSTIERMRRASRPRDATLISVLAYGGLRPGEALGLQWRDIRKQTVLVERSVAFGEEKDTKTAAHRTVRLLAPLASDLREWRLRSGRPSEGALVFPSSRGEPWTLSAYQSWRRKAFRRALEKAGMCDGRPYDLRHSFASLLLHEGRSVIYVARQLGHDARLTLSTYGHVIDELEGTPHIDAEEAIARARNEQDGDEIPTRARSR